jgi:hypothetical protein
MILNITKIRIKNNRYKLHGQIGNKRNIRDMKIVRTKSALIRNKKRGSIGSMNNTSQ